MQKCNTSRTIGIILNRGNPGWYAQLIALEVDDAISTLGTTTTMARSDLTLIIASRMLLQFDGQRFLWLRLCNLLECRDRHATTPWRGWSILSNWHLSIPTPSMRRLPVLLAR